ncbi:hypothetical protein B0H66DRAFT_537461 [Apodospora peruviana]|uniref:Uncharacterized protein n=1 Tax=Apodospora peruviana TaxID=516989 RepID=A0AAE0HWK6_9PEZI|nr:hypothetical protein B0H66DRAFT_537461 [Apodospora peruviana]
MPIVAAVLGCPEAIGSDEVDYCLQGCSNARQSVLDRKARHEFCLNHESIARRFRQNRALLPSSDANAFENVLLLLLRKKKKQGSRNKQAHDNRDRLLRGQHRFHRRSHKACIKAFERGNRGCLKRG